MPCHPQFGRGREGETHGTERGCFGEPVRSIRLRLAGHGEILGRRRSSIAQNPHQLPCSRSFFPGISSGAEPRTSTFGEHLESGVGTPLLRGILILCIFGWKALEGHHANVYDLRSKPSSSRKVASLRDSRGLLFCSDVQRSAGLISTAGADKVVRVYDPKRVCSHTFN